MHINMYAFMCQCIHVYLYVCIHYMNVHMYVQYMYDHSPSLLNYHLVMTNIAMENNPFIDGLPINSMVIFHGELLVITRWAQKLDIPSGKLT